MNYFEFEVGLVHSGLMGSVEKPKTNIADPEQSDLCFVNEENIQKNFNGSNTFGTMKICLRRVVQVKEC